MSALLPRLAAGSVGTAVALAVLAAPTAALAAPGNGQGAASPAPAAASKAPAGSAGGAVAGRSAAHAGAAQQSATAPRRGAGTGTTARQDGRATADAAQERTGSRAEPRRARPEQGGPAPKAEKKAQPAKKAQPVKKAEPVKKAGPVKKDGSAKKDAPTAARPATADPRGNNGTFKVDGPVLDTSSGNEPHVACAFRLNFFGYDAGQRATISFTAIAPTAGSTTTVEGRQIVSTSPAQGGVYGGSYPVTGTWSAADLGLDPTVRQHVKVSVESLNADGSEVPGGAKSKVFWLEPCAATAPVPVTTASMPFLGPVAAPTEIAGAAVTEAATVEAGAVEAGAAETAAEAVPAASAPEQGTAAVSARTSAAPLTVAGPAQAAAQPFFLPHGTPRSATAPSTLPFTGSAGFLGMLAGAVVSLLAGAGMLAAARRSA